MKNKFTSTVFRCLALQLTVTTASPALAQVSEIKHSLTVKTSYGVDVNTSNNPHSRNYLYGLQVSYSKNIAASSEQWIDFFNAQNISFGLVWHNLDGMKEVVDGTGYSGGQAIGALAELDVQLLRLGKSKLLFTPGIGLAYLTETIRSQPATSVIGSHINLAITGELGVEIPMGRHTSLLAAARMQHYSNGAVKVPNGGWNALLGSLGVKTALGSETAGPVGVSTYRPLERNNVDIWLGAGFRGKYRDKQEKFYRTGAYVGYNYFLNRALSFKAGSHVMYYHSVFDPERFDETFQYYGSSYDRVRWGIAAGVDLSMNRFVVNAMYGKYLHYRSFHNVKWYWLSGLRYYLTPNIGLQSTLYLHGAQADYTNWGLVFKL